jgi:four helix bundle protein
MKITKFEDIVAWQKSKEFTLVVYKIFKGNRDYGFKDQLQRACVSVMNNIAEGFERNSDKELKSFLYIAKGSCGEVRSMAHLAKELRYIHESEFRRIYDLSIETSKLLSGFIKKLA